ncbi:diaminopimelate decarboxylase [Brackiella oedipodis]|uniref:diaminopimelate decarboxylase n=1 Tax=Brackiella oedipodis TaxID=124225 RepID=UPI00048AB72E|nr:diaminopimelate decarboxylase [Brackiella oedipodis]
MVATQADGPNPVAAPFFRYQAQRLYVEDVSLQSIAESYGTPVYVYSKASLAHAWQRYQDAMQSHNVMVCYGMKANSNLAVLQLFAQWGSGFDIVSGGELQRALQAGADARKIIFSGVGKQAWEIEAALKAGIKCFNVESIPELEFINAVAQKMALQAPISLRINPDVDAQTHPYISTGLKGNKFGIAMDQALAAYEQAQRLEHLQIIGVDCHIGSQITEIAPYLDALAHLIELVQQLRARGIALQHLDLGGGLGIRYRDEQAPAPKALADQVFAKLQAADLGHLQVVFEPGRSLVGNAGVLLTQVLFLKHTADGNFAIVDAAMNDLLRPTLYQAYHGILPVTQSTATARPYDVVGPVCESGDWFAKKRPLALQDHDLLAIESCGAYGFVMSSQYNSRPRPPEVLVDGAHCHLIRRRETLEDICAAEQGLNV